MIQGIQGYKDLLELIHINENILSNCRENYRQIEMYLLKQGRPMGYKTSTSYVDADCVRGSRPELHADALQKLIDEMGKLNSMIYLQEEMLKNLYKAKTEVDDKLKNLKGLEFKVAYKKYKENKPVKTIWSELEDEGMNYSFSYIEKISAKV